MARLRLKIECIIVPVDPAMGDGRYDAFIILLLASLMTTFMEKRHLASQKYVKSTFW